jgi:N-acetylmuramoyl-L-alanine amidase
MRAFEPDSRLVCEIVASPHHGARIDCVKPDAIVLHYTGLPGGEMDEAWRRDPGGEALKWLCDPRSQVSAHYLIEEDGRIIQLVPEARRAWHAGLSSWRGASDVNSLSIGIEIVNAGHTAGLPAFPDVQIDAVIALSRELIARYDIAPVRVLAHSDVAPGRKVDPGERFPWRELARSGIGHWVEPAPLEGDPPLVFGEEGQPVRALQAMLALYGYNMPLTGVYDKTTRDVVAAFQRHFRQQRVDGAADLSTVKTLHAVLSGMAE